LLGSIPHLFTKSSVQAPSESIIIGVYPSFCAFAAHKHEKDDLNDASGPAKYDNDFSGNPLNKLPDKILFKS
jgi:hypothetical protein